MWNRSYNNIFREEVAMKSRSCIVTCLLALLMVAGCASTEVTERQEYKGGKLPRPNHIWVYDFAATPAEVPTGSALAGKPVEHPTPQTPEQIELGRKLGEAI